MMRLRPTLAVAAVCAVLFGVSFAVGSATRDEDGRSDAPPASSAPREEPSPDPARRTVALGPAADLPTLRVPVRRRRPARYVPSSRDPTPVTPEPVSASPPPTPVEAPQPAPASPPMPASPPAPPAPLPSTPQPSSSLPSRAPSVPTPDGPPSLPRPSPDPAPSGGSAYNVEEE